MSSFDSLKHLNVTIEVGRVKNKNKNPVAEKAVLELEDELIRQQPADILLVKLASLSPLHVLTSVSGFRAYRLAKCRLSGTSSPTNSCHSLILNLYSLNMTCVNLTIPLTRSPRNPLDLFQIPHHSKLEILSTSSQARTSHVRMTATSLSPLTTPLPPVVS